MNRLTLLGESSWSRFLTDGNRRPVASTASHARTPVLSGCRAWYTSLIVLVVFVGAPFAETAQPPDPQIGYIFPPGAAAGSEVEIRLGGFNWTPDLEFFVHDERIRLNVTGRLSQIFLPGAPYLIGAKAYRPPPMPREVTATLHIPADMPPGPVHWQVANASGTSQIGVFVVGDQLELLEDNRGQQQRIEQLPVNVSGRLERHEEVDRYIIRTDRTTPVTCAVAARRLGGVFNVVLEVRDDAGRLVIDVADTRGHDAVLTFIAEKNRDYRVCVRELDFRGNRSYVYRLSVTEGPRVVASMPSGGRRGEQDILQLIGFGLDGVSDRLSSISRQVTFPNEPKTWNFSSVSQFPFSGDKREFEIVSSLAVSDYPEQQIAGDQPPLEIRSLPVAVTGLFGPRGGPQRVRFNTTTGESWAMRVLSRCAHLPLDLSLKLRDADGKQLAENDDLPETLDAGFVWTAPSDGEYELTISDSSGRNKKHGAVYRLEIVRPQPNFRLRVPQKHNVVQGGNSELTVQVIREDGFSGPIRVSMTDLPAGMTLPQELIIPENKGELKVTLSAAEDLPATASLVTVTGVATINDRNVTHTAGTLTSVGLSKKVLVAVTMKPRIDISPIESDERTVHRGTTHLAPIATKRLESFSAQATLQLDAVQSPKFRQGLFCPDVVVPEDAESVFFPCFVPHVCETIDAYRMLVIAVAPVPDVDGRIRYLVSRMPAPDNSIAITVEGALLKITPSAADKPEEIRPGEPFDLPVQISRSAKLTVPLRLEAYSADEPDIKWGTMDVDTDRRTVHLPVIPPRNLSSNTPVTLVICATAMLPGEIPELDDVSRATPMPAEMVEILRKGYLPVMADAHMKINVAKR